MKNLFKISTRLYEFSATVFLYDNMLKKKCNIGKDIFNIIEYLHRKKSPENNTIIVPSYTNSRQLQPRRRIHKIMKGYHYSTNYKKALQSKDIILNCINNNPELKSEMNKNKLSNRLSKLCDVPLQDIRYIITNLKRTKSQYIMNDSNNKITNYFKS